MKCEKYSCYGCKKLFSRYDMIGLYCRKCYYDDHPEELYQSSIVRFDRE